MNLVQEIQSSKILLDYYDGAYGPTIRVEIQSSQALLELRQLLADLASSKLHIINLAQMGSVTVTGFSGLVLQNTENSIGQSKKSLRKVRGKAGQESFVWSLPADKWHRCLCLVDALVDGNSPGHQYLTEEGIDDAVVELAFLEH